MVNHKDVADRVKESTQVALTTIKTCADEARLSVPIPFDCYSVALCGSPAVEVMTRVSDIDFFLLYTGSYTKKTKKILTQMSSDRDCAAKVEADLERWESPEYSLHFIVTKEDLTSDTGKKILELGRQFLQPGRTRVQLVLEWIEGITGEQAEKLIREYDADDKMVGDVSVTVSK